MDKDEPLLCSIDALVGSLLWKACINVIMHYAMGSCHLLIVNEERKAVQGIPEATRKGMALQ